MNTFPDLTGNVLRSGFLLVITGLLAAIPLFQQLDFLPIRLFDESRLVNSALEMSRNHNYLVVQYKGEPEMWSVKPPFMIWCQVACVKLFGANEWAMRFPAALSGLFTILILFLFIRKISGNDVFAACAAFILIITPGYMAEHGTRSGDYDSMLVLFQFVSAICFYFYVQNMSQTRFWTLTCLGILLAAYTKGIAGFMHIPGLLLFAILYGKFIPLLKSRKTWIGLVSVMLIVLSYYYLRDVYNPGYIRKVIDNEIVYRYFDVNEGHYGPWNFYLVYLEKSGFGAWIWISLLGVIAGFWSGAEWLRRLTLFTTTNALMFLLIISMSETKIEWYALPLYPWLSILAGIFFYQSWKWLNSVLPDSVKKFDNIPLILFIFCFIVMYVELFKRTSRPVELEKDQYIYNLSYLFQRAIRTDDKLLGDYYIYPDYNAHIHFYTELLQSNGQHISLISKEKLLPDFRVYSGKPDINTYILSNYKCDTIAMYPGGVVLYQITGLAAK